MIAAIDAIAKPIVERLGYEYVECEYVLVEKERQLVIYIDSKDGITLEDCEKVSVALDEPMDKADPIDEQYYLCVSSVGLDKPMKSRRDFERRMGEKADIKLFSKVNGEKEFTGEIVACGDEGVTIKTPKGEHFFEYSSIALARLHIDF